MSDLIPRPAHWFPPGVSGNPGGRPRKLPDITRLCRAATPEAVRAMRKILTSRKATNFEKIAAFNVLMNYGWGRPKAAEDPTLAPPASTDVKATVLQAILEVSERSNAIPQTGHPTIEGEVVEGEDGAEAEG
jgi:hypothetical protein